MKIKDKPDVADRLYSFDFKNKLRSGETLSAASAVVRVGDVVLGPATVSGTKANVRLSGGTKGTSCEVMLSATTSQGDTVAELLVFSIIG